MLCAPELFTRSGRQVKPSARVRAALMDTLEETIAEAESQESVNQDSSKG